MVFGLFHIFRLKIIQDENSTIYIIKYYIHSNEKILLFLMIS